MPVRKQLSDRDLLEFMRCPLRQPQVVTYNRPPDTVMAEEVVKAALIEVFRSPDSSVAPSPSRIFGSMDEAWPGVEAAGVNKQRFKKFLNVSGRRSASRLCGLLQRYTLFQPVTPYELNFSRAVVSGEYAVMASRKKPGKLLVLRVRLPGEAHRPDVVNHCRWLHLHTYERRGVTSGTLNYCFGSDEEWLERVLDEDAVRPSITSLIDYAISNASVPAPGAHCADCLTDACIGDRGAEG
jgi:hypothetical protein